MHTQTNAFTETLRPQNTSLSVINVVIQALKSPREGGHKHEKTFHFVRNRYDESKINATFLTTKHTDMFTGSQLCRPAHISAILTLFVWFLTKEPCLRSQRATPPWLGLDEKINISSHYIQYSLIRKRKPEPSSKKKWPNSFKWAACVWQQPEFTLKEEKYNRWQKKINHVGIVL